MIFTRVLIVFCATFVVSTNAQTLTKAQKKAQKKCNYQ